MSQQFLRLPFISQSFQTSSANVQLNGHSNNEALPQYAALRALTQKCNVTVEPFATIPLSLYTHACAKVRGEHVLLTVVQNETFLARERTELR